MFLCAIVMMCGRFFETRSRCTLCGVRDYLDDQVMQLCGKQKALCRGMGARFAI